MGERWYKDPVSETNMISNVIYDAAHLCDQMRRSLACTTQAKNTRFGPFHGSMHEYVVAVIRVKTDEKKIQLLNAMMTEHSMISSQKVEVIAWLSDGQDLLDKTIVLELERDLRFRESELRALQAHHKSLSWLLEQDMIEVTFARRLLEKIPRKPILAENIRQCTKDIIGALNSPRGITHIPMLALVSKNFRDAMRQTVLCIARIGQINHRWEVVRANYPEQWTLEMVHWDHCAKQTRLVVRFEITPANTGARAFEFEVRGSQHREHLVFGFPLVVAQHAHAVQVSRVAGVVKSFVARPGTTPIVVLAGAPIPLAVELDAGLINLAPGSYAISLSSDSERNQYAGSFVLHKDRRVELFFSSGYLMHWYDFQNQNFDLFISECRSHLVVCQSTNPNYKA
jgi:hypothetical protein